MRGDVLEFLMEYARETGPSTHPAISDERVQLNLIMRELGQTIEDCNRLIFSSWFGGPPVVRQCPPASLYSWKLVHACILHCEGVPSEISIAFLREGAWRPP